jgi:predicted O-methyltransferase YrrM
MEHDGYEFTANWFSGTEKIWRVVFQQLALDPKKILEIGCYEGRSAMWLLANAFKAEGALYCVDSWLGGIEHDSEEMSQVEARFDANLAKAKVATPRVTLHKLKGRSDQILPELIAKEHAETFDFIYVDGSHQTADVLTDLVLSFVLCRPGGIIVCDEYLWGTGENPLAVPKLGIDAFVNCFSRKVAVVQNVPLYQLFLRKLVT